MVQATAPIEIRGINIAPRATCTQSSLSVWSTGDGAHSVVSNPGRQGDFAIHTDLDENAWLLLDFGQPVDYDEILVFNRLSVPERVRTLVVDISVDGQGWHRIHTSDPAGSVFGGTDGHPLRILTPGYQTRFIRFQLLEKGYLHLVAVEVYCYNG